MECQKGLGSASTIPKQKWGGDIWDIKWSMTNQATICWGWKESPTCWKHSRSNQATWGACPSRSNLFGCSEPQQVFFFQVSWHSWDHRNANLNPKKKHGLESVMPIIVGRSMDCLWATSFGGQVCLWIDLEIAPKFFEAWKMVTYLNAKYIKLLGVLVPLSYSHLWCFFSVCFSVSPWTVPFPPVRNFHIINNRAGLRVQSLWSSSYVSSMSSDQASNHTDDNSTKGQAFEA